MNEGKKYGLVLSKKKHNSTKLPLKSVFGEDSDDNEDSMVALNRNIKQESKRNLLKKQTQQSIEKALAEDPTIFDYDGVYDNIQESKQAVDPRTKDKQQKKSRYVENLLKAAEKRTKENERRIERKVQKEREQEKGEFDDKEAFVTSAYKEKMRQMQEEQEKERRMDAIEAAMDVKNQKDMSGFYRHILKQTTGEPSSAAPSVKTEPQATSIKQEKNLHEKEQTKETEIDFTEDRDLSEDSSSSSSSDSEQETERSSSKGEWKSGFRKQEKRHYRKRKDSHEELNVSTVENSTRCRSSSVERQAKKHKRNKTSHDKVVNSNSNGRVKESSVTSEKERKTQAGDKHTTQETVDSSESDEDISESKTEGAQDKTINNNEEVTVSDPMAKYAKRNVGEKFAEAQMRYYLRKQQRIVAVVKDED